ncbi:MAG: hypothetical protein ACTSX7_01530 [Alphaproteobacteria bacterium]
MNFIGESSGNGRPARWPGFDWNFYADASEISRRKAIRADIANLEKKFSSSGMIPVPIAPPVLINKPAAARLQHFCLAYHRLIGAIVSLYQSDHRLQETITLPPAIAQDALRDQSKVQNTVSLCRIDFYLHGNGAFSVLETNANCPGGLLYAGSGAAFWREQMPGNTPTALPSEDPAWFGDWYLRAAQALTGTRPDKVTMLRQDDGHRVELDEIAAALRAHGVTTAELDPRRITPEDNAPRFGYLKLSIPEFAEMRPQLDPFVDAVLAGDLFIQNGFLGRWIGDNKLCLAVLSDPTFADLFDPADLNAVSPHIPWSRNIAQCTPAEISQIKSNPRKYVLKRPLDTRGRGVIIGCEPQTQNEWETAVTGAINEGWLVMRHVEPTYIASDPSNGTMARHDLALGLIDGTIASGLVRSSPDHRVNVALNGRLHPIFLGG